MQRILLISFLVFSACVGYGQVSISGPTCVNPSTQYQYTISGNWNSGTNMSWCISGGTIVGFGTCRSGTPLPTVQVTWNTGITSGTVTLNSSIGNKTVTVSIVAALVGGTIATNKTQTINYNHIPAGITCSAASGGTCAPSYTYQWQQSIDNVNYTAISGASAVNLSFSAGLLQTTYYRRLVTETVSGSTAYSDVATVFVNPQLQGNILGPAVQDLFPNSTPTGLGGPPAFGGGCGSSYTYQWQQSSDNVNFTNITGATATTYSPPALTATTYYRRMVTCGSDQAFSSVATVNIHSHLAAGTIVSGSSFTITYNTSPGQITANPSTGGICGSYSYQWSSSPNNITFAAISGATGQNYTPGNLTSTIYLQRTTSCGTETVYTTTVAVTVMPQLTNGTITGNTGPITFNNSPGLLNIGTAVSGGNCSGTYAYQWQMSYDGVNFQNIPSATNSTFTPDGLQVNTYYRRQVVCGTESGFSNILNITINPQIFAGTITPAYLSIATSTSPGLLSTNAALGGSCSGSFTYQWQLSTDNITWSDISGATSQNYTPGNLSVTSYYRRKVICGSDIVFTNVSTISVGTTTNIVLNYIRTRIISKPLVTDPTAAANLTDPNDVKQFTDYLDGLSSIVQTVAQKASPGLKDMVSVNFLDNGGKESIQYLPYTSTLSDGNFKNTPLTEQNSFNTTQFPGEQYYYKQNDFEQSPLNRINTIYPQGLNWIGSNRGERCQYLLNTTADSVINWTISSVQGSVPTVLGNYGVGLLFKNITIDEQGIQSITFTDFDGKCILTRMQLANSPGSAHMGWVNTYYVYDDLNNLRFIVTPRAMEYFLAGLGLSSTSNELCYRYEFDQRKRTSIKKVPGVGETWMVYDSRDRLVMSQDANLRAIGKWLVIEYDSEDRPWRTGLLTDANNQVYHQNLAYNSISYPSTVSNYEILTQTYYENYVWVAGTGTVIGSTLDITNVNNSNYFNTSFNTGPIYSQAIVQNIQTRSLATGGMAKVLGTTNQYLYTVNFYDDHNRIIQSQSTNVTGGKDASTMQFDFASKRVRSLIQHQKNGTNAQSHIVLTKMNYDANGRLTTIYKNVDNASTDQLIVTNSYSELDRTLTKQLGNNLDNLTYTYNIRGWLTSINKQFIAGAPGNYFGMELGYDKLSSAIGTTSYLNPLYNGNINGIIWKSAGDGVGRKYDFTYDNLNRLATASFVQNTSGSIWDNGYIDFTTNNLSYDVNGNILSMNQKGFKVGGSALIDQLVYSYQANSNKLIQVNDAVNDPTTKLGDFHFSGTKQATDYSYDLNGNLIVDNNKSISAVVYNYLNLPQAVTVTSKGTVSYTYDATGTKLYTTTVDNTASPTKTTVTTYIGGFVYQATSPVSGGPVAADTLQFIGHEEGRTRWAYHKYTNGYAAYGFEYDYFEKDHLGNTRVVLTQQKDTSVYLASGEAAFRATESQLFTNLTTTAISRITAPGYPNDLTYTAINDTIFKVNGNVGGHKTGPSLLLKVMSGDKIDLLVQSFYNSGTTSAPNSSVTDVLASLASGIVNSASGSKGSISDLNNTTSSPIYAALNSFMTNETNPTGKPKAYLNWILLDDQLKYVSSYPQSGAIVVGAAGILSTLSYTGLPITKNGYLYIWVSNETPNWDVFFDNLKVVHYPGPELEETHFYPFGLTMAAISSKALKPNYIENKFRFNKGAELQNKEFSDGSGLEYYETFYRQLDPQLGRWWQIDPKSAFSQSPYSAMGNNPITSNDPLGDTLLTKRDHNIAARLTKELNSTNAKLSKEAEKTSKNISEAESKGNTTKANNLKGKLNDINSRIAINKESLCRLDAISNDPTQAYTFKLLPPNTAGGTTSNTMKVNGQNQFVVTMAITGDASAIHEITHAYQADIEGKFYYTPDGSPDKTVTFPPFNDKLAGTLTETYSEIEAYAAQYAFDPGSMPASTMWNLGSISAISSYYVAGINTVDKQGNSIPLYGPVLSLVKLITTQ